MLVQFKNRKLLAMASQLLEQYQVLKTNCQLALFLAFSFSTLLATTYTYFTIILALFIVMIIGAFLGYSGNFEDTVKTPFEKALKKYNDQPAEDDQSAQNYKSVWNEVQAEVRINCDGEMEQGRLTGHHRKG